MAAVPGHEHGREATLKRYPCTLPVLEASIGLIQHSEHGVAVMAEHYGEALARQVNVIPLLCTARTLPTRAAARAALGLADDLFVVCSFGGVVPHKNPMMLRGAWIEAGLPVRTVWLAVCEEYEVPPRER